MEDITIGRIVAPHGIRGEVKLTVMTDFPERFEGGNVLTFSDKTKRRIEYSRISKDGVVMKLEGVDTRDDAEALRNVDAVVKSDELAGLGEDEFFLFELMGLNVVTCDGEELGKINEILQSSANDVYVTDKGVCVPALKSVVKDVDISGGVMKIDPPDGLI